ncbi:MAG: hypothetical protein ACOCV1_07560 [Bacillota bacterium]
MPERLLLTKNAQFYKEKEDLEDIENAISKILDTACANIKSDEEYVLNKFQVDRIVNDLDIKYKYSVRVYPSGRPVYFFDDDIEDTIYALILIIEYLGYIAIFKKSCANINDVIKKYFIAVDGRELTSTFNDNKVEFQKLSTRNMTISDKAIRSRSYEAADLKGLLSTHAAGRSIPYFLKLRQGTTLKTISTGTGRVVESSQRKPIDDIAVWVHKQLDLLNKSFSNNKFLDSFAKRVELKDIMKITNPNSIFIESPSLYDRIELDQLEIIYAPNHGSNIKISSRIKNKLFKELEHVFELNSNGQIIGYEYDSKIRKNDNTLTFTSKILKKFRVIENGKEYTLQKFIIKNGFYTICFDDPKYMYFRGMCFEDSSGISELDSILKIFHPIQNLYIATSEKGKFNSSTNDFDSDSIFDIVEKYHNNDDYIFCDDLGIEWADHITFNKNDPSISFIHSKFGDISTSASNLHDVVGQAIKNLGNMIFNKNDFMEKLNNKLSNKYSSTNIDRIRKGEGSQIDTFLESLISDYKLYRKCIICCSFISKKSIEAEFKKIKNNQNVRGNITQLIWIISSFAHAVKDMNIIPIIYCNE